MAGDVEEAVPGEHVPHERVLDQLIAFGRTDGIRRRLDDQRTSQLVSPRRTRAWARSYRNRAEQLEAEGRMQPAGAASVALARATGGWDATAEVDALDVRTAAEARVGLRVRSNGWASSAVRH